MKRSSLITILASFLFAGCLHAASDYLLELDGIKGESKDDAHPESIEIDSFTWGVNNSGASAGGGMGKVSFSDLHCTARVSKATPQLLLACADGRHFSKARLIVRKPGADGREYYTVTLEDLVVSSLKQTAQSSTAATTTDSTPVDQVVLYFNSMTIVHTADDETVTTGRAVRTPIQ